MLFKEYATSAYHIIIPGLKPCGLLIRQEVVRGAAPLGHTVLLSFPEIGVEDEYFISKGDVGAIEKARAIVKEKVTAIYNTVL